MGGDESASTKKNNLIPKAFSFFQGKPEKPWGRSYQKYQLCFF